ncbi:hypothetical protein NH8B_0508 [Pseudogulbenkiania sp. NH8B]|uniref:hypothetical protein n=1 Tax=Pseudogulbenkiania sp. (strain NH8B) TaxID=748280 RepID=UPI000227946F|nr:hypothetical protein [Pseudogulbenkiania sp. NH8B]BAK75343.1 hypothetical protein NH8B_0508 [Pseudogulbenkiania sp. NH8B]
MSTSYFVVHAEPQTFIRKGEEQTLINAHVTGIEHTLLDDARQELQELMARTRQPLKLIRVVAFNDDREPCTLASHGQEAMPCL